MNLLFICYPRCTTCKRAKKWLEEKGISFDERDISKENPTADELREWRRIGDLPLKKLFNTSGMKYREMGLKDKLSGMSEEEQFELLATDGMLVKRPIIVGEGVVLVGFREQEWEEKLLIR